MLIYLSLLEIKNSTLLERAINLLISHGVHEISINVHYLSDQIKSFINRKKFKVKITISNEENLLDTGGGALKGTQNFGEEPFFVINPDTVWREDYIEDISKMIEFYFVKKLNNTLLVSNKKMSFDKNFKGDFDFKNDLLLKNDTKNFNNEN